MYTSKKKNEIFAFLWLIAAVLLFLCLISFSPNDIPYLSSTLNSPLQNIVGIAGAYVSFVLIFLIGKGSFFLVFLFCFWALAKWSERKEQTIWLRILSGSLFFISTCACLSLISGDVKTVQFQSGGLLGYFAASILSQLFGMAALIVAIALFGLALLLATEFMIFPLFLGLVKGIHGLATKQWSNLKEGQKKQAELKEAKTSKPIIKQTYQPMQKAKMQISQKAKDLFNKNKDGAKPSLFSKPVIKSSKEEPKKQIQSKKEEKIQNSASVVALKNQGEYSLPSLSLLNDGEQKGSDSGAHQLIQEQSEILQSTLLDFSIDAKVVEVEQGPVITRFELQPASGVKLQKITALQDNIALALQATSVRILAPIPGKARIGIEVPNAAKQAVNLKDILLSSKAQSMSSKLTIALGKDAAGAPLLADLDGMPHLLIAGSTGSGKTVCMNTIIMSILYRATPEDVRLIMVDPKMVEMISYNGLPHLLVPVITNVEKVPGVLNWLVYEMQRRYKMLSKFGCRDVETFNERLQKGQIKKESEESSEDLVKLPYIVLIIDELADLMMAQGKEVESAIARLAQLARAVGIHMILATQRPSVDVITGVIKANFPARIAFQVASKVDSRTVLDANGADTLLGRGDLLYMDPSKPHLIRAQGAWVSDEEIEKTVTFIKAQREPIFQDEILKSSEKKGGNTQDFRSDEHYEEACRIIVTSGQASVSMLQRRLGLGYTRAARLVDMMEEDGIVGPHRGSKARDVLMSIEELEQKQNQGADKETETTESETQS